MLFYLNEVKNQEINLDRKGSVKENGNSVVRIKNTDQTQGTHKEDMLDCSLERQGNLTQEDRNTGVKYKREG